MVLKVFLQSNFLAKIDKMVNIYFCVFKTECVCMFNKFFTIHNLKILTIRRIFDHMRGGYYKIEHIFYLLFTFLFVNLKNYMAISCAVLKDFPGLLNKFLG